MTGLCRAILLALAIALLLGSPSALHAQTGTLDTLRSDVREGPPPAPASDTAPGPATNAGATPASAPSPCASNSTLSPPSDFEEFKANLLLTGVIAAGYVATSPFWAPHELLGDDFVLPKYFPRFPYDDSPGYLVGSGSPVPSRSFAVRLDADYVEPFDHLDLINGHILVSTTSRIEFDARIQHLGEPLAGGQTDQLWIGDCNVMFRFAQSSNAQFRAGLGVNWLNDPSQTDLGFNFTYGIDLFPARPLVLSTVMDAGTLGHAGLFRFRTTAGVVYRQIEFYTGYEYTDIGRTHWNGLIGGVRLWF